MLREPPLGLKRGTFLPFLEAEEVCELSISIILRRVGFGSRLKINLKYLLKTLFIES